MLNLAAGFDTRPYRLALPSALLWIEGDRGPLIEEKEELLRNEVPAAGSNYHPSIWQIPERARPSCTRRIASPAALS